MQHILCTVIIAILVMGIVLHFIKKWRWISFKQSSKMTNVRAPKTFKLGCAECQTISNAGVRAACIEDCLFLQYEDDNNGMQKYL